MEPHARQADGMGGRQRDRSHVFPVGRDLLEHHWGPLRLSGFPGATGHPHRPSASAHPHAPHPHPQRHRPPLPHQGCVQARVHLHRGHRRRVVYCSGSHHARVGRFLRSRQRLRASCIAANSPEAFVRRLLSLAPQCCRRRHPILQPGPLFSCPLQRAFLLHLPPRPLQGAMGARLPSGIWAADGSIHDDDGLRLCAIRRERRLKFAQQFRAKGRFSRYRPRGHRRLHSRGIPARVQGAVRCGARPLRLTCACDAEKVGEEGARRHVREEPRHPRAHPARQRHRPRPHPQRHRCAGRHLRGAARGGGDLHLPRAHRRRGAAAAARLEDQGGLPPAAVGRLPRRHRHLHHPLQVARGVPPWLRNVAEWRPSWLRNAPPFGCGILSSTPLGCGMLWTLASCPRYIRSFPACLSNLPLCFLCVLSCASALL
mmetsp:Transcript_59737/g.133080  ORF Transcript_59737/g.133080 Transcript_59737/m.133080 type:complete len:428 (+) Transcript_59737:252-1535(+)